MEYPFIAITPRSTTSIQDVLGNFKIICAHVQLIKECFFFCALVVAACPALVLTITSTIIAFTSFLVLWFGVVSMAYQPSWVI